jgi:hypothetical protein
MPIPSKKIEDTNTKSVADNLRYKRDKDREMVRGKFIYHEVPGGQLDFSIRLYKGDPIENYSLKDGEVVNLPLGVAKHLNQNVWYPAYSYENDANGRPQAKVSQRIRRCSFQSLEFIDVEGIAPVGSTLTGIESVI